MSTEWKTECESFDAEWDRQFGLSARMSPLARLENRDPDAVLSARAHAHVAECERCRNLYAFLASAPSPMDAGPELRNRVESTLKSSLKPVKPIASAGVIAGQLFLVFVLLAVSIASILPTAGLYAMSKGQLTTVTGLLIACAVLLSFSLAWQMRPGSLHRVPVNAAMAIAAAALVIAVAILFPWQTPDGFFRLGFHCLKAGIAMAVPSALLFSFLLRRGAPMGLATMGGTVGAIAGLVSTAVLQSNCAVQDVPHLLVWHGGVVVVSALIGYLIGRTVSLTVTNR